MVPTSVTRKNCQMSIKVAQNDFTRKIIDFDIFTKNTKECERIGQNNCCQSPINCQILSHWLLPSKLISLNLFQK